MGLSDTLGDLANIFDRDHYALVVTEQLQYTGSQKQGPGLASATRSVVTGIVTRIDLLNYISSKPSEEVFKGSVATSEK